jgi:tight adherence protein C
MQLDLLLSVVGVFACVAVISGLVISTVLERGTPEHKRLQAVIAGPVGASSSLVLDQAQLQETPDPFLAKLSKALPRSPKEMTRLRRRLAMAGYYDLQTAVVYSAAELVCPVILGGLPIMILGLSDGWIIGILGAIFGYLTPGLWLMRRTNARQRSINNGLPDALDLFIVCMEAGSSLDQAILKASEELDISHPDLSYELRLITTEIRAGKPRIQAFKNFANRTGVDDVRALVSMLVQTDRFGTSVSQALRTHASTSRTKRRQQAEERAGKIGVKLVFPLVLCLFPAVYIVCMGPVVIKIYRAFF